MAMMFSARHGNSMFGPSETPETITAIAETFLAFLEGTQTNVATSGKDAADSFNCRNAVP